MAITSDDIIVKMRKGGIVVDRTLPASDLSVITDESVVVTFRQGGYQAQRVMSVADFLALLDTRSADTTIIVRVRAGASVVNVPMTILDYAESLGITGIIPSTTLEPAFVTDSDSIFAPGASSSKTLVPTLVVDSDSFYSPTAAIPWAPTDLSTTLRQWYPMDQLSGSNGDPIGTLTDKSATGLNTMAQTGTNRPTLATNALNGKNVVACDATANQYWRLQTTLLDSMTKGTIVAVFKCDDDPAPAGSHCGWCRIGNTAGGGDLIPKFNVFDAASAQLTDGNMAQQSLGTSINFATDYRIVTLHCQTNDWSFYMDGTLIAHQSTCAFGTGNVNFYGLCADWVAGRFLQGKMAEFALYTDVDTTIRQKFEGYEAAKWGLQGNLPGGHPYKSSAP